jgi:hypothetical protein
MASGIGDSENSGTRVNDGSGWVAERLLLVGPMGNQTFGGWPDLAVNCRSAISEQSVEADTSSSASAVSCRPTPVTCWSVCHAR